MGGDAVIGGEDDNLNAFGAGRVAALPGSKPFGDFLQSTERARRFRQYRLALPCYPQRLLVCRWNIFYEPAQLRHGFDSIIHLVCLILARRASVLGAPPRLSYNRW